jgi:hypothetical protein
MRRGRRGLANDRHRADQRRNVWPPEPGFFSLRLVRNGWPVPARIVCDGGCWYAIIDGLEHPPAFDPAYAPHVARVWERGTRVDRADYDWRNEMRAYAAANEPAHPCLRPTEPMDPLSLPPLRPRTP